MENKELTLFGFFGLIAFIAFLAYLAWTGRQRSDVMSVDEEKLKRLVRSLG